ncbi:hypothetical protein MU9_3205 [Morganella morganii subsp. morganii KT]|uniref:Uncharacterized protein n=1 Tax=Morganella morganii subsp. morganii KT TaxID=1124991 RepID=M1SCV1_MORMO|nr:hypothetical protein MU9_3205 [Morganella morganii subsp. morganii KT]
MSKTENTLHKKTPSVTVLSNRDEKANPKTIIYCGKIHNTEPRQMRTEWC